MLFAELLRMQILLVQLYEDSRYPSHLGDLLIRSKKLRVLRKPTRTPAGEANGQLR